MHLLRYFKGKHAIIDKYDELRCLRLEMRWEDDTNMAKRIESKFYRYLEKVRAEENVYLKFYESVDELNDGEKTNNAAGTYRYLKYPTAARNELLKLPQISLVKSTILHDYVWVYAHELGHHFAITRNGDNSELAADNWIEKFVRECLTDFEMAILKIQIEVYGRCKIDDLPKVSHYTKIYLRRQMIRKLRSYDKLPKNKFAVSIIKLAKRLLFKFKCCIFNYTKTINKWQKLKGSNQ